MTESPIFDQNKIKTMAKADIFKKAPETGYNEPAVEIDRTEFIKTVESRRSVRVFTDEKVAPEDMEHCLELALMAPNSSNLQPWEFYWVKDEEKKEKLKAYCLGQPAATTAQELVVCVARLDTWRQNNKRMLDFFNKTEERVPKSALQYYKKLVPIVYNQGPLGILGLIKRTAVFFMGLKQPTPRQPVSHSDMRVWAHKSAALGCENLMLALRAFGYDSCPMEGMDSKRIQKLLGLPKSAEICMVVSAGKRAPNGIYGKRIRFDKDLFIKKV